MKIIKSNKASLITGAGLKLVPGINQVKDEVWANALKTRAIQQMLKDKVLVDQTPKEIKQAPPEVLVSEVEEEEERVVQPSALKVLPQNKAIDLVKETLDLQLLADWEIQEARVKVKAAIKSQKDRILAETKPKKKEGEETEGEEVDEGEEG